MAKSCFSQAVQLWVEAVCSTHHFCVTGMLLQDLAQESKHVETASWPGHEDIWIERGQMDRRMKETKDRKGPRPISLCKHIGAS